MIRNTIPQDRGIGRLNRRVKPEGHGWPESKRGRTLKSPASIEMTYYLNGRLGRFRTADPHHVKVVLYP